MPRHLRQRGCVVAGHYPGLGDLAVPRVSTQALLCLSGLFVVGTVDALTKTLEMQRCGSRGHASMQDTERDVSWRGSKPDHSLYTHSVPKAHYLSTVN